MRLTRIKRLCECSGSRHAIPLGRTVFRRWAMLAAFVGALALGEAAQAQLNCTDISGTPSGDNCTLDVPFECSGNTHIVIPGDLTITSDGAITCGSNDLDLDVGGNLEVQTGGAITANGSDGGGGADGANGADGQDGQTGITNADCAGAGDPQACCTGKGTGTCGGHGTDASAGGAGGDGDDGSDAGAAGNLDIDVEGNISLSSGSVVSANGADGGDGGSGGDGGVGGSGGTGNIGGGDGGLGADGGDGGSGGDAGTCSNGGNVTITSGTEAVPGSITIAGLISADGGGGANGGDGGEGVIAGTGGSGGTSSGNGNNAGNGGDGSDGGNGTPGCNGGVITLNQDFTVTASGVISAEGGDGGDGGDGADGGNAGNGGSGSQGGKTSTGGDGGDGGNGGDGGMCGNGGDGGSTTINSDGDVDINGTISAVAGAGGVGGEGGENGTLGNGGIGNPTPDNNGNDGTDGADGTDRPDCNGGANGSNTINYCDTASVDTTGANIDPEATENPEAELCKAVCGDDVVNQPIETCDGADAGDAGCSADDSELPSACRDDCTCCGDGEINGPPGLEQCEPPGVGDCDANCREIGTGEGCTPGYWKLVVGDSNGAHHECNWAHPYDPDDLFEATCADCDDNPADLETCFTNAFCEHTLIQVLDMVRCGDNSGRLRNFGFHTVAALLNAASQDVEFGLSMCEVIEGFNAAVAAGEGSDLFNQTKTRFANLNECGQETCGPDDPHNCPLGNCRCSGTHEMCCPGCEDGDVGCPDGETCGGRN